MRGLGKEQQKWLLMALALLALITLQSWITYRVFTSRFPGGNDFAARFFNGCALIWSGENPYADEVTLQTQFYIYGEPAPPGEDLVAFSYPIYALYFFWPLCFFQPGAYQLVQAIWMTLLLYSTVIGTILIIQVSRLKLTSALLVITLVWVLFNYPEARALLLGQMVIIVFLLITLALLAIQKQANLWAGALLAAATIKPQVVFLVVLWLLWWSAWQKRWRVWWGFGITLALMSGIGLILIPSWPADFLRHLSNYAEVTISPYYSLTWMIVQHFLGLPQLIEILATSAIVLYLFSEWWRGRRAAGETFLWITGLTLNLTNFVAVQIATTAYILLLIPLFQLFRLVQHRTPSRAKWIILAVQAILLIGQWWVFLITVDGRFETAPSYLLMPLGLLLAQLASRSQFTSMQSVKAEPHGA